MPLFQLLHINKVKEKWGYPYRQLLFLTVKALRYAVYSVQWVTKAVTYKSKLKLIIKMLFRCLLSFVLYQLMKEHDQLMFTNFYLLLKHLEEGYNCRTVCPAVCVPAYHPSTVEYYQKVAKINKKEYSHIHWNPFIQLFYVDSDLLVFKYFMVEV